MSKTTSPKKHHKVYIIIASIWICFSSIFIIQASYESKTLTTLQHTKEIVQHINIYIGIEDFDTALQLITGEKAEDYYNRWTIKIALAYQNALKTNALWLETSQILLTQAKHNFDIAKQLWAKKNITHAIKKNIHTIETLSPIVDIKTCYSIGQSIHHEMNISQHILEETQQLLTEQELYIEERKNTIPTSCYMMLYNTQQRSKEQIDMMQQYVSTHTYIHTNDIIQRIEDPSICLDQPYKNIVTTLQQWNLWLEKFQKTHQNTNDTLKKNNKLRIHELCNQTKNDAEIHQHIEQPVRDMLESLESYTKAHEPLPQHIPFNKTDQHIIEEIKQINKERIHNTLDVRGKGNYDPRRHINTFFYEFYGNPDDFIDLRK